MDSEPELKRVHADARGEMYSITLPGGREIMLLHSKAGSLRGGHLHSVDEHVIVLEGRMRYHKQRGGYSGTTEEMETGDYSFNQARVVHMGEFLEDSWVLEVKDARIGEWTQANHEPWRQRVRENGAAV